MTESKKVELNDIIKRYSVLKRRKAKIDEELKDISESVVSELADEPGQQFVSHIGRITLVLRKVFVPDAAVKARLADIRDKAEQAGDGSYSRSIYPKFTVN